tara:strand:- start:108 stop:233 length:126 start_codon:yes stop_codon:yes gene_type:complete
MIGPEIELGGKVYYPYFTSPGGHTLNGAYVGVILAILYSLL